MFISVYFYIVTINKHEIKMFIQEISEKTEKNCS
jgi:hypothetical protein